MNNAMFHLSELRTGLLLLLPAWDSANSEKRVLWSASLVGKFLTIHFLDNCVQYVLKVVPDKLHLFRKWKLSKVHFTLACATPCSSSYVGASAALLHRDLT